MFVLLCSNYFVKEREIRNIYKLIVESIVQSRIRRETYVV